MIARFASASTYQWKLYHKYSKNAHLPEGSERQGMAIIEQLLRMKIKIEWVIDGQ